MSNQHIFGNTPEAVEYRKMTRAKYAAYIARVAASKKAIQDITDDIAAVQRKIAAAYDVPAIYRLNRRLQELIEEQYAVNAINGTPAAEVE